MLIVLFQLSRYEKKGAVKTRKAIRPETENKKEREREREERRMRKLGKVKNCTQKYTTDGESNQNTA